MEFWNELNRPSPASVPVHGVAVRRGDRVRLMPGAHADIVDLALAGRVAIVEGIDESIDGAVHVAVTIEDDPGRDLGAARYPGHRFFFLPEELEPLAAPDAPPSVRILVAGIGNIFLGDDGFGVAVARRLAERTPVAGITVRDFGIRGLDLAYELQDHYDAVVLVDATPRGGAPGTLYVLEPELDADAAVIPDAHGMDPVRVLHLARTLGRVPPRTIVVGCEPDTVVPANPATDVLVELSQPVAGAIEPAVALVDSLLARLVPELQSGTHQPSQTGGLPA